MFKLVSLRASGFKRLDIEDKLLFPDGRLLVHGRNESGKSTLMEAIHYALYGMPLRPSKNAGNEDIICYGRDHAIVELEFSIDDSQYLVRRELYRKKTNIHLLNKREQGGTLSRITTGARNVNSELSEILHGIDSDALLNSCLVEQKELGKLEDANKQERIRAMSSLLNLEAFVDARNTLKKEGSDLEKIHMQTLNKLGEAEKAKEEYEDAEKIRESAEKRLTEIEQEKKEVEEKLDKLRKTLEIIQQMKIHQQKINENTTRQSGKQDELKLLREQLEEIEKSEKELQIIEEKLPEAKKRLVELDKQLETVQQLSELNEKLTKTESRLETIEVKLAESQRVHNDAAEARERIQELDEKIKQYTPVKAATKKIDEIAGLFNKLTNSITESTRLEKELETVQERLGGSKDSEELIKQLEEQEKQASSKRAQAQNRRTYGMAAALAGLVITAIMVFYSNLIAAGIGAVILGIGGYLIMSKDPGKLEEKINQIRAQREQMLGDRARIRDYHESIEKLEADTREVQETKSKLQEEIIQELNQLPDEPREYKAALSLTEPDTINQLRAQIQEDTEILTRLTTEKKSLQRKADSLESSKNTLDSNQREKETQNTEAKTLSVQIEETEHKSGIKREEEEEIRKQHTEANNTLTGLNTQKNSCQKTLERRPQTQENINETSNEINLLSATIQQEEKKLKELTEHGVDLGDEPTLNEERDANLRKSASLEKEEQERGNDIEESNKIIEKTADLREEYPVLVEESEHEEFRVEAMRRATILLDTTRDSIMSGVKQNVEKNMMQFLPTLTDNRYNRARIDEANYRIEVYDREAKQWRGKGVFSGATQDQFSLALRLAFAISTIPSSRGARPGFIFLDEPLSGFDTQRRNGFMQLLREDLSKHFDQIIVISHLEALADEFQNSLTLDSGRIIEVQR
jgi:exonuclease SbcC